MSKGLIKISVAVVIIVAGSVLGKHGLNDMLKNS